LRTETRTEERKAALVSLRFGILVFIAPFFMRPIVLSKSKTPKICFGFTPTKNKYYQMMLFLLDETPEELFYVTKYSSICL